MGLSFFSRVIVGFTPQGEEALTLVPPQFVVNVKQVIGKAVRRGCALLIIG
jgi:hypothetical protein